MVFHVQRLSEMAGEKFLLKMCVPWAVCVIFKTGLLKWPTENEVEQLGVC
jgi:hypothetical protein